MKTSKRNASVTFDMLQAYVTLADTLNLTETSVNLGVTRQTVRRHINDLEAIKGRALFTLEKHEYQLTPFGMDALGEARSILRQVFSWTQRSVATGDQDELLESARFVDSEGREFFSQQHPISKLAKNGLPIMKDTLSAWGQANTEIECDAMESVRPFLVIYRRRPDGWVCVEIGEKSAYTRWFGWAWSKSAIGMLSHQDNAGDDFNDFIAGAYSRIYREGGVRLDHLFAHLPRESNEQPVPISFQRLLMGCVFPDETPALAVLVVMTNRIDINALENKQQNVVPTDMIMDTAT
ncbi:MAG: LysR family transcriptional regulator [Pseudomonadota bacterium]